MRALYLCYKQLKTASLKATLLAVCFAFGASGFVQAGDIDNPGATSDCYKTPMKFIAQKRLRDQIAVCQQQNPVGGSRSSANYALGYATTCMGNMSRVCGPIWQKHCDVDTKYQRRQAQCVIKMRKLALDQKRLKEQQEQFQREQRQAEQRRQDAESKRRSDMYAQLNQVQKYKDSAIVGSHLAGRIGGATQPSISGSYYLSQAISQAGTRFITGSTANALLQLEAALYAQPARQGVRFVYPDGGYSASNPRPTLSNTTAAYDLYQTIMGQANRTATTQYRLPLQGGSAVSGPLAGILTQIVKSQLSGKYPDLDAALAGFVATGVTQAIDYANDSKNFTTDGKLAKRRQEIFARVEAERIRSEQIAAQQRAAARAAARKAANSKKQSSSSSSAAGNNRGASAISCLKFVTYHSNSDKKVYRNSCSQVITCDPSGSNNQTSLQPNSNMGMFLRSNQSVTCKFGY